MNEPVLTFLVMGFGVMLTAVCAWAVVRPAGLVDWVRRMWGRPWSRPLAVTVRLLLGAALIVAARGSKSPAVLAVFGWLVLAGAVFVAMAPREWVDRILDWAMTWPTSLMRLWLVLGGAFGVFLVWSVN